MDFVLNQVNFMFSIYFSNQPYRVKDNKVVKKISSSDSSSIYIDYLTCHFSAGNKFNNNKATTGIKKSLFAYLKWEYYIK